MGIVIDSILLTNKPFWLLDFARKIVEVFRDAMLDFRRLALLVKSKPRLRICRRPQVEELATWLEAYRAARAAALPAETWLQQARGAARPGVTTAEVMALTRGDE